MANTQKLDSQVVSEPCTVFLIEDDYDDVCVFNVKEQSND